MAKTKTARKPLVISSLQDRIAALHAEIDEIVARHVDAVAKECGSIPEGVVNQIEGDAFGRAMSGLQFRIPAKIAPTGDPNRT
jgi:hypothetical protein